MTIDKIYNSFKENSKYKRIIKSSWLRFSIFAILYFTFSFAFISVVEKENILVETNEVIIVIMVLGIIFLTAFFISVTVEIIIMLILFRGIKSEKKFLRTIKSSISKDSYLKDMFVKNDEELLKNLLVKYKIYNTESIKIIIDKYSKKEYSSTNWYLNNISIVLFITALIDFSGQNAFPTIFRSALSLIFLFVVFIPIVVIRIFSGYYKHLLLGSMNEYFTDNLRNILLIFHSNDIQ